MYEYLWVNYQYIQLILERKAKYVLIYVRYYRLKCYLFSKICAKSLTSNVSVSSGKNFEEVKHKDVRGIESYPNLIVRQERKQGLEQECVSME